jgi:predicted amidohydrolase YtcJ
METELGSVEPGKIADFVVLEQDPYEVDPGQLEGIGVWGTVFEGTVHPVES